MRKKSLAVLLALAMLLGLFPAAALAVEPEAEGEPVVLTVEEPQEYTADFATAAPVRSLLGANALAETGNFTTFGAQLKNADSTGYATKIYQALCNAIDGNAIKNGQPISVTLETQYFDGTDSGEIAAFVNSANSKANEMYAAARDAAAAFDRDHSDVFWTSGLSSLAFAAQNGTPISGTYSATAGTYSIGVDVTLPLGVYWAGESTRDISAEEATVDSAIAGIVEGLEGTTDYEKLLEVHDWLTHNNAYNQEANAAQTPAGYGSSTPWEAISALTGDTSMQPVCEGYARAFKLICDELKIPCVLVSGLGNVGAHMWNYVQMEDGNWYAVDVTWDDPTGGETGNVSGHETDTYFLVGSTKLDVDHTAQSNNFLQGGNYEFTYPTLSVND